LVTSRERLNMREEWSPPVEGLPFPDRQAAEPIDHYPAVQLFLQRARQVKPEVSLAEHAHAVVDICRHVEGMPLALEPAGSVRSIVGSSGGQ
jgi:predicted ATPase